MNKLLIASLSILLFLSLTSWVHPDKTICSLQQVGSANFLAKFCDTNAENLHIYSPFEGSNGKRFEGKKIDSTFYKYFSKQSWFWYSTEKKAQIFGCFKFRISSSITGLLVRIESQYSETAIDLCLWDNNSKEIKYSFELADKFGDGGWYFVKDAWLTDLNKDGLLDIIIRKKDNSNENENIQNAPINFKTSDSIKVYISHGSFYKRSKTPIDTARYNILNW
jgi:hypothetical protein